MRVIIGGSRSISTMAALEAAVARSRFAISAVITGNSRGVDALAVDWARLHGIEVTVLAPEWSRYGGRAEHLRNQQMIARAQGCIAIWDGFSRGTAALIEMVERSNLALLLNRCNPQHATEGATTRLTNRVLAR
jgi:hypothetical protein